MGKRIECKSILHGKLEDATWQRLHRVAKFYYPKKSGANNHIIDVNDLSNYYVSNEGAGISGWGKWWVNQQLNFQINYDNRWGDHHVNALPYTSFEQRLSLCMGKTRPVPLYQTDQFWAAGSTDKQFSMVVLTRMADVLLGYLLAVMIMLINIS